MEAGVAVPVHHWYGRERSMPGQERPHNCPNQMREPSQKIKAAVTMPTAATINNSPPNDKRVDKTAQRVQGMFAQIAPRYDLVNRLLSGGIDVWWRSVTVRLAPPPDHGSILDVCTGTGDLALAYAARCCSKVKVVGADFCRPMLDRGVQKSQLMAARKQGVAVEWIEADAMHLPFPDASFELVTVAFGLRNIVDTRGGLAEMARVCKPGGRLAILEFSLPKQRLMRSAYLWYFRHVLPRIGQFFARNNSDAYNYLPESVGQFPDGQALADRMTAAGLVDVTFRPLTFGVATLYVGTKPGGDPVTSKS